MFSIAFKSPIATLSRTGPRIDPVVTALFHVPCTERIHWSWPSEWPSNWFLISLVVHSGCNIAGDHVKQSFVHMDMFLTPFQMFTEVIVSCQCLVTPQFKVISCTPLPFQIKWLLESMLLDHSFVLKIVHLHQNLRIPRATVSDTCVSLRAI